VVERDKSVPVSQYLDVPYILVDNLGTGTRVGIEIKENFRGPRREGNLFYTTAVRAATARWRDTYTRPPSSD
jgi:hypothetical protein